MLKYNFSDLEVEEERKKVVKVAEATKKKAPDYNDTKFNYKLVRCCGNCLYYKKFGDAKGVRGFCTYPSRGETFFISGNVSNTRTTREAHFMSRVNGWTPTVEHGHCDNYLITNKLSYFNRLEDHLMYLIDRVRLKFTKILPLKKMEDLEDDNTDDMDIYFNF